MPDLLLVMPDLLGHLLKKGDCRSGPAMTGKVGAGNDGKGRSRHCTRPAGDSP